MMINAVCTVIRPADGEYVLTYQGECTWQDVRGFETKKYGEERADSAAIWIYDLSADIAEGDIITRAVTDDYASAAREGMTVTSVSKKDYGDLRHIRLGAK